MAEAVQASIATENTNNSITKATGIVSIVSGFSFILLYIREYIVSSRFGAGAEMDAFLVAYALPVFYGTILAVLLSTALIPAYTQAKAEGITSWQNFCNRTYSWLLLCMVVLTGLTALVVPWISRSIGSGFSQPQIALVQQLTWILLPSIFFSGVIGFITALLVAEKQFWSISILPVIPMPVTIGFVWLGSDYLGIQSIPLGITIGSGLQTASAFWMLRHAGVHLRIDWRWDWQQVKRAVKLASPILVGIIFYNLIPIIDRTMASHLPMGSIAALGYAERVLNLIYQGFAAIQTVIFPFFSDHVTKSDIKALRSSFLHVINLSLFFALPIAIILGFFSIPLIDLFFGRGAFHTNAVIQTGQILLGYSFGFCITIVGHIALRIISSFQDHITFLIIGIANVITKTLLNLLFIPIFGVFGISLSFSFMMLLATTIILIRTRRLISFLLEQSFNRSIIKIASAGFGMTLTIIFSKLFLGNLTQEWSFLIQCSAGCISYITLCYFLRLEGVTFIYDYITSRAAAIISHNRPKL